MKLNLGTRKYRSASTICAVAIAALTLTACSKGGDSGSPSEPSPANIAGNWNGNASDSSGPGTMAWQVTQNGSSFSGTLTMTDSGSGTTGSGSVSGTLSGSTVNFSLTVPVGGFSGSFASCSSTVSGSGSVSGTSITGTYSGSSTCTGSITSGQLTLNKQ